MIRNAFFVLSFSILASSSVFATVTSHKELNVPEIKLTLNKAKNNSNLEKVFLNKAKANKTATEWLQATSKINDVQFIEDEKMITGKANTSFFLGNFRSEPQVYTVTHFVCTVELADDTAKEERCSQSSSVYNIDPESAAFDSNEISVLWRDIKPGDYFISFGVSIQNSNSDTLFSSNDHKFITIPR